MMNSKEIKVLLCAVSMLFCTSGVFAQIDFRSARDQMVRVQLKARGITDKGTLDAMNKVPRQSFVPEELQPYAYSDGALPIGEGQTISQPFIVAFMTQSLRLKSSDKVLEIGTGSGYQAAVLAEIVDSVYTIEIVKNLGNAAKDRLRALGYRNVEVRIGDGYNGWPGHAPFDAIMVTAGAETLPMPLVDQLAEGGRMIIPVGPHRGIRQLLLITKKNGKLRTKELMAVRFVPFTRDKQ